MNRLNEYNMWVNLYEKKSLFMTNSVDEFLENINDDKLLEYIEKSKNKNNKIKVFKIIIDKVNLEVEQLENVLKDELEYFEEELKSNEDLFRQELINKGELKKKIKTIKEEKNMFYKTLNNEKLKSLDIVEKIINNLDSRMDRIKENGLKSILDRKGFNLVESLQCFKKNLYECFMNSILTFKNYTFECNVEIIIKDKINKEIENIEKDLTKYLFEEYISEAKWSQMINSSKEHSRQCIEIYNKCVVVAENMFKNELENKEKKLNELLEETNYKLNNLKKKIEHMNISIKGINDKYENELKKLSVFKEIIRSNYIKEYNKIVRVINREDTNKEDIKTYYEYLYLITSEIEKVEDELYG